MDDTLEAAVEPARVVTQRRVDDPAAMQALSGERDRHLRWLADRMGVGIFSRGAELRIEGSDEAVRRAEAVIDGLLARVRRGQPIDGESFRLAVDRADPPPRRGVAGAGRVLDLARTANQRRYVAAMASHDVVFGCGPAGTGKTFLAVASAIEALERHEVKRIVLTRPAVEAGERLGFLPGDLVAKVNPYLRPLLDALGELSEADRVERMIEKGRIEIAPLAFMRGRTLSNAFVILDEAQNCTVEQMQMLLTRIGHDARCVVTGDPSQTDLPRQQRSGLAHALDILRGVEGIDIVELGSEDVVRHPVVARIAAAYARDADARTGR